VKTSEGDLFSIKCPGPGSDCGRYWKNYKVNKFGFIVDSDKRDVNNDQLFVPEKLLLYKTL
jgi:hypothetical protein